MAEQVICNHLFHGEEIPIPAAVMEHTEHHTIAFTRYDHGIRLRSGQAHDLIDHNVFTSVHRLNGQRRMGIMRCGQHDQLDLMIL